MSSPADSLQVRPNGRNDGRNDSRVQEVGPSPAAGQPVLDVFTVLAAMQQQLDDLREIVQAQQRTLQLLLDLEPGGAATADVSSPARGRR
jgi:hypothetical protein